MQKNKSYVCFLCKTRTSDYVEYKNKRYCKPCLTEKKKLEQEQQEWEELYDYVFFDVLGYTEGMKMTQDMVLRLRGLRNGQFKSNKTHKKYADYSYKIILYTFKAKKLEILQICDKIEFKNESHKINTIMKIIENNINDVVLRMNKKKEVDKKSQDLQISDLTTDNTYQGNKKEDKIGKMFKNLW